MKKSAEQDTIELKKLIKETDKNLVKKIQEIGSAVKEKLNSGDYSEGFTFSIKNNLETPEKGFAIGCDGTQLRSDFNTTGNAGLFRCIKYILENPCPGQGGWCIGGWNNSEYGLFQFDATYIIMDEKEAIAAGRKEKQQGIFNLGTFEYISLDANDNADVLDAQRTAPVSEAIVRKVTNEVIRQLRNKRMI